MIRSRLRTLRRRLRRTREHALGRLYGVVVGVDTDRSLVALTFDDGPDPVTTPRVLEVLERHGARATFFMIGRQARRHPDLVARVAAAGHTVAHHTADHLSLTELDRATMRSQIAGGYEAVMPYGVRLFRPPRGHLDLTAWRVVRSEGHEIVAWTGHAFDWTAQDAPTLTARLQACLKPGAIVLLHDAPQRGDATDGSARSELLVGLEEVLAAPNSWRFVTVPELLVAGRPRRLARWQSPTPEAPSS